MHLGITSKWADGQMHLLAMESGNPCIKLYDGILPSKNSSAVHTTCMVSGTLIDTRYSEESILSFRYH